jgi:hypothetical protein
MLVIARRAITRDRNQDKLRRYQDQGSAMKATIASPAKTHMRIIAAVPVRVPKMMAIVPAPKATRRSLSTFQEGTTAVPVTPQTLPGAEGKPVPLVNTIRFGSRQVVRGSGGVRVLVDQAAKDGSSADPSGVEVGRGGAGRVAIAARDLLFDALVRPGGVVVRLILG